MQNLSSNLSHNGYRNQAFQLHDAQNESQTSFFLVKFHLKLNSISSLKVVFTCLMVNMVKIRFLHFNIQIQYSAGVHVNREIRFLVFCFYFSFILVQIRIIQVFCVRVGRVILNKIMTLNRRSYQYNEDDFSIYGLISDNFLKISTQLILVNQLKGPAMHVDFFQPITHECPQQISAQSIQQFGRLYATYIYIYTNVLFYYINYIDSPLNMKHSNCTVITVHTTHVTQIPISLYTQIFKLLVNLFHKLS